ncbi:MAG: ribosome maturation factor RimM [Peptococcaceae bacterium]|nr:ribosome maturation factor RimM [Peptococcaceae bacterium]
MGEIDIVIGKIVGTYGHRGMVKVFPLTDFPDRFFGMDRVTLEQDGKRRVYTVAEVRRHRKHVLIRLEEVADMTGAESLRGAVIKIGREELTPLPEGSYYIFDIVGLKVFTEEGGYVGVVEDVLQTGANDVYVVDTGEKAPVLVPALKDVVREIDIRGGRMVVRCQTPDD